MFILFILNPERLIFSKKIRAVKFIETDSRKMVVRGLGQEEWGVIVSWVQGFSFVP